MKIVIKMPLSDQNASTSWMQLSSPIARRMNNDDRFTDDTNYSNVSSQGQQTQSFGTNLTFNVDSSSGSENYFGSDSSPNSSLSDKFDPLVIKPLLALFGLSQIFTSFNSSTEIISQIKKLYLLL
mmetsp:Transcript_59241/g.69271  ORF Transcript_59241/g.69271 Transcript_59241/m.69271 type:complete len:125 (+) Transcript_59241:1187-1561(+)